MPRSQVSFDDAIHFVSEPTRSGNQLSDASYGEADGADSKLTVVFADDTLEILYDMVELLEAWGFSVTAATDGREAIDAALACQPDIVVSDISMPAANGYEVARQIRAQPWGDDVLMIAHSGIVSESASRAALDAGFDYFLPKPADFERLKALLSTKN